MTVHRTYATLDQALPDAAITLSKLGPTTLHFSTRSTRHPFAIYNLSFGRVVRNLVALLSVLSAADEGSIDTNPKNGQWPLPLTSCTENYIYSLFEHVEDCEPIILSFVDPANSKQSISAVRSFKAITKIYRTHIATIANHIKHNQRRVRLIQARSSSELVRGYFVEGALENGAVGPCPIVHSSGAALAFSYNRDLRYHICAIFEIGAALSTVLQEIDKSIGSYPLYDSAPSQARPEWSKALIQIASSSTTCFPTEAHLPSASVTSFREKIKIDFPSAAKPSYEKGYLWCESIMEGDGATRTYTSPSLTLKDVRHQRSNRK